MEYNTSQNKFRKNWDRIFQNKDRFRKINRKKEKIDKKLNQINNVEDIFQVAVDFSFDWITPNPTIEDSNGLNVGSIVEWSVLFPDITEEMRSAIQPVIIRRFGNAGVTTNGSLKESTSLSENIVFYVDHGSRDLSGRKNYILNASVYLNDSSGIQGDIQFKLLLYIISENTFI